MNIKNYKRYIVVDEDYKPMAFDGDQFVYCHISINRNPLSVKTYSYNKALSLIRETIDYRLDNNFKVGGYHLMPVGNKIKKK